MTRARMIFGYGVAVVFVVWVAGTGHSGDHGASEAEKKVCLPVPDQKKVTTKTFSCKTEEFCLTPLRGLFGQTPQCGPVRTKRVLVLSTKTNDVPSTKYIPVVQCAQSECAPAATEQPAPGAVAPPGPMAPGGFPAPGATPPMTPGGFPR